MKKKGSMSWGLIGSLIALLFLLIASFTILPQISKTGKSIISLGKDAGEIKVNCRDYVYQHVCEEKGCEWEDEECINPNIPEDINIQETKIT